MHPSDHTEIVKRLKPANGHLQKTIKMIEKGRPCLETAQQLQAVDGAIAKCQKGANP